MSGLLWSDDLSDNSLQLLGRVILILLSQPQRWVHRRVERIYFKDHKTRLDIKLALISLCLVTCRQSEVLEIGPFLLHRFFCSVRIIRNRSTTVIIIRYHWRSTLMLILLIRQDSACRCSRGDKLTALPHES